MGKLGSLTTDQLFTSALVGQLYLVDDYLMTCPMLYLACPAGEKYTYQFFVFAFLSKNTNSSSILD